MGVRKPLTSYADDIKIIAKSEQELNEVVESVRSFLACIGLAIEVTKSTLLVVGDDAITSVKLLGQQLKVADKLRFLGVGIDRDGKFFPWLTSYTDRLHMLWNKLNDYGFGASLIPFMKAYNIFL